MFFNKMYAIIINNPYIRLIFIYYMISILIWFVFFYFYYVNLKSFDKGNTTTIKSFKNKTFSNRKLKSFLFFASIFIILFSLIRALNYVGYIPYGQDTALYTGIIKKINETHHYIGQGYYNSFHTSAVFFMIFSNLINSISIAYTLILIFFLVFLILIVSLFVRKKERYNSALIVMIAALLFLSSPTLKGFDLLQQYVSLVYGLGAILYFLSKEKITTGSYIIYTILIVLSAVTHLSSLILVSLLIIEYFLFKRKNILNSMIILASIFLLYSLFIANLSGHILSFYKVFLSLFQEHSQQITIRAIQEVPAAKIYLFSWVLLPSLATSYIFIAILLRNNRIISIFGYKKKYLLINFFIGISIIFVGFLTRTTKGEYIRYFLLPSYQILYVSSLLLFTILLKNSKKPAIVFFLIFLIISPYTLTSFFSEDRSPWMGEPRLAPVTYFDRIEMMFFVHYASDYIYVYYSHDIYIPIEEAQHNLTILTPYSYYPSQKILLLASNDLPSHLKEKSYKSYIIINNNMINTRSFSNYNIIFKGIEHSILAPLN